MRKVLFFTLLTLVLFVYQSVAQENNICRNCSLMSDNPVNTKSSATTSSPNTSVLEKNYRVTADAYNPDQSQIKKNKNHDLDNILFKSQIDRLDNIFNQYKSEDDSFFASTKRIDILSGFRTGVKGQDVFVPLGFFVYLNKKF